VHCHNVVTPPKHCFLLAISSSGRAARIDLRLKEVVSCLTAINFLLTISSQVTTAFLEVTSLCPSFLVFITTSLSLIQHNRNHHNGSLGLA
jgi:hypothetical protein